MTVALFRVDDRLIHGQVVMGWGTALHPHGYLVVDDRLAGSDWERDLYRMGVPEGTDCRFVGVDEAPEALREIADSGPPWIVLLRDIPSALRLARTGAMRGATLNLGGIHATDGVETTVPYLRIDPADLDALSSFEELGVEVAARDLPGNPAVRLSAIVR